MTGWRKDVEKLTLDPGIRFVREWNLGLPGLHHRFVLLEPSASPLPPAQYGETNCSLTHALTHRDM
jgi:hypothetical protein